MTLLTKSKYLAGLQCPKLLWFLVNDKDAVPEPSADAKHKMEVGTKVGEMAQKLFPDGVVLPSDDFQKNLDLTKTALNEKKPLFEAGFMTDNLFARVDILEPNKDDSWNIIEVKSGTKVKEENVHDVSFQKHVLEKSGLKIKDCFLCHINNEYVLDDELDIKDFFKIENINEEVKEAEIGIQDRISEMLNILSSSLPVVTIGKQCSSPYPCTMMDECWGFLPDNHIFNLYRGGKKCDDLFSQDIQAIADIPEDFKLTNNQAIQLKCEKTGKPHIQKKELKQFLDGLIYPLYYLDFETINPAIPKFKGMKPYQRIPFQYSLHIEQNNGKIEHFEFLAEGSSDPRRKFLESLKKHLGTEGSIVVYNEGFEKGVLKELAEAFPEYAGWINELLPRIVDLLVPFRNFHYYDPKQAGSASIKKVLPVMSDLSYVDMIINNGGDASLQYEMMVFETKTEDQKTRDALLEYCKMDTLAEVEIVKKLKKLV